MESIVQAAGYVVAPLIILIVGLGITVGLAVRASGMNTHHGWRRGPKLERSLSGICSAVGAVLAFLSTLFMYSTLLPAWEHQVLGMGPFAFVVIAAYAFGGPRGAEKRR